MNRRRGTLYELHIVLSAWGVVWCLAFPRLYPAHPPGLAALYALGLVVTRLYGGMLTDGPIRWLGLPLDVWVYLTLSGASAGLLWGQALPVVLSGLALPVLAPYLAFRLHLWAISRRQR